MGKRQLLILCAAVAFVFASIAGVLTYVITKNSMKNEMYVPSEEYEWLLQLFEMNDVEQLIAEDYYTEIDNHELVVGALEGMVEQLGDGYSCFYREEYFQYFDEDTEGTYISQGMLIDKDDATDYVKVAYVFADTPAYEANITAGNLITTIDGMDTRDMDAECAVSCLRGNDGTEVTLEILAGDSGFTAAFPRKNLDLQVVFTDMLDSSIGYINIIEFSENSVRDFQKALEALEAEGAQSIVIDLRDTPGGYISQASEIADMLLVEGTIYYTVDKNDSEFEIVADEEIATDKPIVLLVNEGTKGVAEVFAAALQDNERAQVVGARTYGKGVLMSTVSVPNSGDGLRLVTGFYYTPDRKMINNRGIIPDVEIEMEQADSADSDAQLQAAMDCFSVQEGQEE